MNQDKHSKDGEGCVNKRMNNHKNPFTRHNSNNSVKITGNYKCRWTWFPTKFYIFFFVRGEFIAEMYFSYMTL